MTLSAGTRLGTYEITAAIGAGGMGEVFRGRDTTLNRDVAIKVLPASMAAEPERLARFKREAQVLASLNHPNIAHVHGFEAATLPDGSTAHFLAMEMVEGEDLSERLKRGAIPVDESIAIARQIAEGLEEAHERGIIHRDLKPANVKVTPDGKVKVLDFGLAKALEGDPASSSANSQLSHSPTMSRHMTEAGMIMGTAAYMSPEQAKGKSVDRRADIWSFGVVLFEMLTGQRLFAGETVSDVLAAVLREDIDWTALPKPLPPAIAALLKRCLDRDVRERLRDIGEARVLLGKPDAADSTSAPSNRGRGAGRWPLAATLLAAGLVFTLLLSRRTTEVVPAATLRVNIELSTDTPLVLYRDQAAGVSQPAFALSRDGTTLAFAGREAGSGLTTRLYVRRLDELAAHPLAGTEGGHGPFFSPDGEWLAFFADKKLKKVPTNGGAVTTLAEGVESDRGGTWAEDGPILFAPDIRSALQQVAPSGGKPQPLGTLDTAAAEATQRWPQALPGERAVLYTSNSHGGGYDDARLVVRPLDGGPAKVVLKEAYFGRYLPGGYLVFIRNGSVFSVGFDPRTFETKGEPAPVIEGVQAEPEAGFAQIGFADNGIVAYLAGAANTNPPVLQWLSPKEGMRPMRSDPAHHPRFSPDGRRIALETFGGGEQGDLWVYDWSRDTMSRLTYGPTDDSSAVWSPDGKRIAFTRATLGAGRRRLYWQLADGTGEATRLTDDDTPVDGAPFTIDPSGRFVIFDSGRDFKLLTLEGDERSGWKGGKVTDFLTSPFVEREPEFSPDGRFVAYVSDETGQEEVYVRPFPGPGGKWQVSNKGGRAPRWSKARPDLFFYEGASGRIMGAAYSVAGDAFMPSAPRSMSAPGLPMWRGTPMFDVHPDGQRFVLAGTAKQEKDERPDQLVLMTNFLDELRRLSQPK